MPPNNLCVILIFNLKQSKLVNMVLNIHKNHKAY